MLRDTDTRARPLGAWRKLTALLQARKVSVLAADKERPLRGCRAGRVCRRARPQLRAAAPHVPAERRKDFLCSLPAPARSPRMNHELQDTRELFQHPGINLPQPQKKALLVVLHTPKLCKKYTSAEPFILLSLMAGEVKAEKCRNCIDELCRLKKIHYNSQI